MATTHAYRSVTRYLDTLATGSLETLLPLDSFDDFLGAQGVPIRDRGFGDEPPYVPVPVPELELVWGSCCTHRTKPRALGYHFGSIVCESSYDRHRRYRYHFHPPYRSFRDVCVFYLRMGRRKYGQGCLEGKEGRRNLPERVFALLETGVFD